MRLGRDSVRNLQTRTSSTDHVDRRLNSRHGTAVSLYCASSDKKKYDTLSATHSRSIPDNKAIKQIQKTESVAKKADDKMEIVGIHDITGWGNVCVMVISKKTRGKGNQSKP